jgi:hypothetical protein
MPNEVKNYIVFNEHGKIKKHTIGDLYAGSHLVDAIYLFADFNISDAAATLMFRRSDGQLIGEVDCLPDNAKHPITGELVDCFSFVLGKDVLAVAGPLQITARYYYAYVIDGDQVEQVRATGMVTANVYETVPTYGAQSTVILNLNRKINTVAENLTTYIDEADRKFGTKLAVDGNDIALQNEAAEELSRVRVPTVILAEQPGDLIFFGTGDFIIGAHRKYVIVPVGSSSVGLHVYERNESGETGEVSYTKKTTNPVWSFTTNQLLETRLDEPTPSSPFDGTYYISGEYWRNGVYDTFEVGYLHFGGISQYSYPVLGLHSVGYYQVYLLE